LAGRNRHSGQQRRFCHYARRLSGPAGRCIFGRLFLLPIAGVYGPISNWLPSALASAPADLLHGAHHLSHYLPAFAVTAAVSAAALAIAALRLREI